MSKLNEEQKKEYLSSGFHQYLIIDILNKQKMTKNQPANLVITLSDLDWDTQGTDDETGLGRLANFVNKTFSNFLFTPKNDFSKIFQYEYYQGSFFIRMEPYTPQIVMHILPQKYEGFKSGDVLFFKDTRVTPIKHHYYRTHSNKPNINLYYQHQVDGVAAGDRPLSLNPVKFSKFSNKFTYINYLTESSTWEQKNYMDTYGEFDFDISEATENLDKIQINAGYQYNESSSDKNVIHYTGIYDNHSIDSQRAVLIDANYDGENANFTNVITQLEWNQNSSQTSFPQTEAKAYNNLGFNNSHLHNIGKTFFKTIKYWNDDIFISEKNDDNDTQDNYKIGHWTDPDPNNGGN